MSSDPCSCTVPSTTVAGTLTGGIQDIAALLPLLGTEQCEDHVSSALTKGYLYAAASPMSLFGSLGLARAGLKTFLASFSIPAFNIAGARTLSNMGFKPQGMNLSLIMIDPNDKDGRYLIDTRLEKLVEELHIDKAKIQNVRHKTLDWNLKMTFLSAILSSFGVIPYIFLTVKIGSTLPHQTRWTFPALRVVGGCLTTVMIQFVIQRRVTALARRWISEHCSSEAGSEERASDKTGDIERNPRVTVTDSNSPLTWFLLILLLLGVFASIVGYVGCFSVVQSANRSTGPLSWLCLEGGLSLLRMFLWGYNPKFDDAPPLELVLARDRYPPLPTCKLYDHDITAQKVLPLTRANQFLNSMTSFTGVVDRFDHPDVTLYYTLTRKAVPQADSQNVHEPGEHILYITIFDHKERANTRVYTQRGGASHFYATESGLPVIDPKQGLLEIKLGDEIDSQDDPITSDRDIRSKLDIHYRSIMDQMHFVMTQSCWDPTYRIENRWTMAMAHTTSTTQKGGRELTEPTLDMRVPLRDFRYLQHGRLERMRQSLSLARGEWIATYMHWVIQEMGEKLLLQASSRMESDADVDDAPTARTKAEGKRRMLADETETMELRAETSNQEDFASQVIEEIRHMELLLVKEMQVWEEHLWDQANKFTADSEEATFSQATRHDMLGHARLIKERERGFQARLDTDIRAMEARLNTAELGVKANSIDSGELMGKWQSAYDVIRKAWQTLAQRYVDEPVPSTPPTDLSNLDHLHTEFQKTARDVEAIIRWSQPTAAQRDQLRQQSEVANRSTLQLKEAVFWMDNHHGLTDYKLFRSKWLMLSPRLLDTRALMAMNDTILVNPVLPCDYSTVPAFIALIRHFPSSLTSIYVPTSHRLPVIQRDTPLFVNNPLGSNKIETFLDDNQSQLGLTRRTHIFVDTAGNNPVIIPAMIELSNRSKIAVSFFGPPSGNLVLKFTHCSLYTPVTLTVREHHGSTRTFEYIVPFSLTRTDITLFPSPSDHPSFVPDTRNNLIIEATQGSRQGYVVQDVRLHDEAGNDYNGGPPEA